MAPNQIIVQVSSFIGQMGRGGRLRRDNFKGDVDCEWADLGRAKRRHIVPRATVWAKPVGHAFKLNTDASVAEGGASSGGIVRSVDGNLVFAFYKGFGEADVITAETKALLTGLQLCHEWHLTQVGVEVDSSTLVSLVSSCGTARWPLVNIFRHIQWLVAQMGCKD